ncbi:MAG: YlxR family protein [Oscillospiraceae bacterium]|nr:YlxR family protein [Oscillospiraceae bacterium]
MELPKKIPMRQCLGCRVMKPKRELIRVVRSPEGDISIDFKGKKSGRGAYVCHDMECLKRAIKSKALSRAFGVPIPDNIIDELNLQMEGTDGP